MAGKTSVTLRLGAEGDEKIIAALKKIGQTGDAAMQGLSKEARNAARDFDRLEKSLDGQARSAAQVAKTYVQANAAVAAGVRTQQDAQRVLDLAEQRHLRLTGSLNDNTKAAGLARHEWINLSRQFQDVGVSLAGGQKPLTVLLQQGSTIADIFGSSKAGAAGALRAFGAGAVRALTSPIGIATALGAAVAAIGIEAGRAQKELATLGEQSRLTGLPADILQGAKKIGAGAGLDEKGALTAFANAGKQFQAYGRNEGEVKSVLEGIDKGFLKVLDRARSAAEFIDILNDKIRSLPTAQAEQLARALYQDEGGAKLVDAIRRGEVSMRALMEASGSTGNSLNQAASAADEMQKRIALAAQEADNKLLNAMKNIKSPTDDIKLGWYSIVGAMADAVEKSERLQRTLKAMTSWTALFNEIGSAYNAVDKMLGARPVVSLENENLPRRIIPGDIPFPNFNEAKQSFLPKLINAPVGDTRDLFPKGGRKESDARAAHHQKSGRTPEQTAAENFAHIKEELQAKIAAESALGGEYDKENLKLKILNEQHKIGRGAIQAQKDEIAALVTKLDDAERAHKANAKAAEAWRDTMREVGDIARSAFSSIANDLVGGKNAGAAFRSTLEQIERKLIDIASRSLTDSLFGAASDKSSARSLTDSLFGAASDKSSGGGLFGGLFKGFFSHFSFPGFPDGGLVGDRPRHIFSAPLSAFANAPHFANGGGIPAFLHAGEIVLNAAQQKNVAGQMAPNVSIHNYASGVEVTPQMTPDGLTLIVKSMIDANNRNLPSILADRSNRR